MNRVKIMYADGIYDLEDKINRFAESHKILNVSISTCRVGYTIQYTAAVVYEV